MSEALLQPLKTRVMMVVGPIPRKRGPDPKHPKTRRKNEKHPGPTHDHPWCTPSPWTQQPGSPFFIPHTPNNFLHRPKPKLPCLNRTARKEGPSPTREGRYRQHLARRRIVVQRASRTIPNHQTAPPPASRAQPPPSSWKMRSDLKP